MTTLQVADAPQWTDWASNFGTAYNDFQTNYQGLLNIGPWIEANAPDRLSDYQSLVAEASGVATQLASYKSDYDTVQSWLSTISQAEDAGYYTANAPSGFSGFGAAASLLWTVGSSLVAAFYFLQTIQNIINKIASYLQNISAYVAARSQGLSPTDAQATADHIAPVDTSTTFLSTGPTLQTLLFIGIALWLAPAIISAFFGKRT